MGKNENGIVIGGSGTMILRLNFVRERNEAE